MILGVGTDIVEIKHLKKTLKKNPKVIERLFTAKERMYAQKFSPQKRIAYYSKRFAGKEAITKACGTGIGKDISWQDLEILNDKRGKPTIKFSQQTSSFLKKKFKVRKISCFLSLTDEKEYAMAFSILSD